MKKFTYLSLLVAVVLFSSTALMAQTKKYSCSSSKAAMTDKNTSLVIYVDNVDKNNMVITDNVWHLNVEELGSKISTIPVNRPVTIVTSDNAINTAVKSFTQVKDLTNVTLADENISSLEDAKHMYLYGGQAVDKLEAKDKTGKKCAKKCAKSCAKKCKKAGA